MNDHLMKPNDWKSLQFFTVNENWGDPSKMHSLLLYTLDAFRKYVGLPVHINCGYSNSGHVTKSMHYVGKAVDLHIKGLNVVDQFLAAERFDAFNGIGLYPHWNNPGLHLDIRPKHTRFDKDSRWMAINKNGKQVYIELNAENIKKYCL